MADDKVALRNIYRSQTKPNMSLGDLEAWI